MRKYVVGIWIVSLFIISFDINAQTGTYPFCSRITNLPTLSRGSTNTQAVKDLQGFLNYIGASPTLTVDGIYGLQTSGAVSNFNTSQGIFANDYSQYANENRGNVVEATLVKMKEIACNASGTATSYTLGTESSSSFSINLKANGSDGPISILPSEPLTLSWTGNTGGHACVLSGSPTVGFTNFSTGVDVYTNPGPTSNRTTAKTGESFYPAKSVMDSGSYVNYNITCQRYDSSGNVVSGGSYSDSVRVGLRRSPLFLKSPNAKKFISETFTSRG